MDAKAKIVRWECRPLNWEVQYQQRDDGELVKFTDHEAALAEHRKDFESVWNDRRRVECELTTAETKLTTLLTGLEALAGEWDGIVQRCIAQSNAAKNLNDFTDFEIVAGSYKDAAERVRALVASAGLEGKP